jgi:hypothetical protein
VRAAIQTLQRILKPSGVLLATFPGITQTYDPESRDSWYWNFTPVSAERLFSEVFPKESLEIDGEGNVFAAISFLHGLSADELDSKDLDYKDPGYVVTNTVRVVRPGTSSRIIGR